MKKLSRVIESLTLAVIFSIVCTPALTQNTLPSGSVTATPESASWYTPEQAANGAKAFQKTCARCHGAKLQGAMGPALVGKQFWLAYGGKKVSTLWSVVHTEMPMMAPGSVSAKNSINIMAFLLRKNGVPSGTVPLDDTADLSKALPVK